VPVPDEYNFKEHDGSSHAVILEMIAGRKPSRILDLGCSSGLLAEQMRARGHFVVGVDNAELPGVRARTDSFFVADLAEGIPAEVGTGYDVIVAGDVVEHLPRPLETVRQIAGLLRPQGQLLLSVPNFSHWYPRLRVATGLFGYDRRGILDQTHLRFFTRRSLRRMVTGAGFDILEEKATGLPLGAVSSGGLASRVVRMIDRALVGAWPTMFGYQYVMRLTGHAAETVMADHLVALEAQVGPPLAANG
jgi:SAM-dependent methyltransferase